MTKRHLVSLWDSTHGPDVLAMHTRPLLHRARLHRLGQLAERQVAVWWGEVGSPCQPGHVPHLGQVLSIDRQVEAPPGPETHLYLTDYRSLYVAHVGAITADDVAAREPAYVPAYHRSRRLCCALWVRLWDIRRLVADDPALVADECRTLIDAEHEHRPVSLYGGLVQVPLVVEETEPRRYFDPAERDLVTGGRHWVEWDAARCGVGVLERELREDLLGDRAWKGLGPAARAYVATAERLYRDRRCDPGAEYGPVILAFAKALEVQTNLLVRAALGGSARDDRYVTIDGDAVDVAEGPMLSLEHLQQAIAKCGYSLVHRVRNGGWLTTWLPGVLEELAEVHARAAQEERVDRVCASAWRSRLLGIGCDGELVRLGRLSADAAASRRTTTLRTRLMTPPDGTT